LPVEKRVLKAEELQVVHVPVGYGTAFRALENDSELLVFADHGIDHAPQDDYTWPLEYFVKRR
jgi:dTDP-4-dehydrorhamnose 3,5-epimerase